MSDTYASFTRKKTIILIVALIIMAGAFFFNLFTGSSGTSIGEMFATLFNPGAASVKVRAIVWDMRMPIAIMGVLVGAALGVAGAVMQTILNNPMASPYTLGVSAGAGVGASMVMVLGGGSLVILGKFLVPAVAFIFAIAACMAIYFISKARQFTPSVMVLAGIGMVFFFQALQSFMQYMASAETLQNITFWTFGSLQKADWVNMPILAIVFGIVFIIFMANAWKLTAMRLGDNRAKSMGVNVDRVRKQMFILISILTATAVAFVGTIGFIGIVGPHIARMILGEDQRYFMPMSAVCGAIILSLASGVSKVLVPGAIFPIGIITSLIGVPFYLILLLRKR